MPVGLFFLERGEATSLPTAQPSSEVSFSVPLGVIFNRIKSNIRAPSINGRTRCHQNRAMFIQMEVWSDSAEQEG